LSKVAAIVVTYNNNEMLGRLMEDIMAQTRLPDEIIVVDNGDDGHAGSMIKEKFSRAKYIKMPENTGSAGGYYAGIKAAMEKNDFVWTLDDDVRVPDDSLKELIDGFERLAASRKIAIARSVGVKNPIPDLPTPMDIFTWRGSLIKTEVFAREGMINKDFFIYGEDIDFSCRLSKKGYIFYWIPASVCYDKRAYDKVQYRFFRKTTVAYAEAFRLYYAVRNHLYIYTRNGYYLKTIKTLLYGLKIIFLILAAEGLRGLVKVRAVAIGSVHGFMGKLGKSYNGK
jgi:GT2 family glycosyltransferase